MDDPLDSQHTFEQRSLRNVRALVENLENHERKRRKWIVYTVAGFLPIALLAGAVIVKSRPDPAVATTDRSRPCELAWWGERSGEFERRIRDANPGMPYRDIQKQLERERPSLMASAKAECNARAK